MHAELRTEGNPLRVQLAGGAAIELSPDGSAALAGELELLLGEYDKPTLSRVDLRRGELRVVTRPTTGRRTTRGAVLVYGPEGVMVIVGRDSTVRVRALPRNGDLPAGIVVALDAGDARVATRGAFKSLPVGEMVELRPARPVPASRPLGSGPRWIHEEGATRAGPLAIVTAEQEEAPVTLRFAGADDATGYDVEIARDEAFTDPVLRWGLAPTETTLVTPPLRVGRYFARVRTRGHLGLAGHPGPTRLLRVVHVALPKGTELDGDTILLPRAGSLTWNDPRDLEVSIGRIGFVWATERLGLVRQSEPLTARVRLAGEESFIPLTLVQRPLRTEIDIGPKRARWPSDPVHVEVRLVDPRRSLASFEPKLEVTVNLEPLRVQWRREGDTLLATIPPRTGPGPWVVSVEATDSYDNELGRGFLEVIGSEPLR